MDEIEKAKTESYLLLDESSRVKRYKDQLPQDIQQKYDLAIEELKRNPLRDPRKPFLNKHMRGRLQCKWRRRVGDLRILYEVNEQDHSFRVREFGPRGDIYKKDL